MHGPADPGHIAIEVSQIAATPDEPAERAAALLEPLHQLLPFDGAWLALREEKRRGHHSLVSTGWDRRTAAYLDGPVLVDEIEQLGMTRSHTPLRVADFPSPARELRSWAECLLPAGFREGLGMCLFAADGRHLGFLGLFTGSPTVPSDAARDLLAALGPTLAQAIDPLRSVAVAAQMVHSATAAVILTRSRGVLALPGLPDHEAFWPCPGCPTTPRYAPAHRYWPLPARCSTGRRPRSCFPRRQNPAATCVSPVWTCLTTPHTT
jgi:hypothetical protein